MHTVLHILRKQRRNHFALHLTRSQRVPWFSRNCVVQFIFACSELGKTKSSYDKCERGSDLVVLSLVLPFPYRLTYCVFSTPSTTPDAKNTSSHLPPTSLGQRLLERSQGVKVRTRQSRRFCQRVAGGHRSASAAPPNDSAMTTLYQSNPLFL